MTLLPIAKLGYLAIRTAAKPVAAYLKNAAATNPFFRKSCISVAQMYHYWEVQFSLRLLGHPPMKIKPLDEARAVTLATEVLGEIVIFGVAGAVIVAEVTTSRAKETAKENALDEKFKKLEGDLALAREQIQQLQTDNMALMKHSQFSPAILEKRMDEDRQRKLDILNRLSIIEEDSSWWGRIKSTFTPKPAITDAAAASPTTTAETTISIPITPTPKISS